MAEPAPEPVPPGAVQHVLADVAERRVPDVVPKPDGLRQVLVEAQRPRDGPADAGHLERVRQPRAVVIALRRDEHLRLVLEPPERLAVHDPVAIALERRAHAGVRLLALAMCRIGGRRERRMPRGFTRLLEGGEVARDLGRCAHPSHSDRRRSRDRATAQFRHEVLTYASAQERSLAWMIAACAAATRAIGTRNGEHDT